MMNDMSSINDPIFLMRRSSRYGNKMDHRCEKQTKMHFFYKTQFVTDFPFVCLQFLVQMRCSDASGFSLLCQEVSKRNHKQQAEKSEKNFASNTTSMSTKELDFRIQ